MLKPRKKGNLYPLDFYLEANGVAISDVATSRGFTITLTNKATMVVKVLAATVTVVDAPTALLRWTPLAAHVDTPGEYLVEVAQVRSDFTVRDFPSRWYEEIRIYDTLS